MAGGALTAVALWLLSGLASPLPQRVRFALILAFAAAAVLRDLGLLRLPLPQNSWQIPQHVLQRGILSGPLRFGFELGTGVRTYVSATAPYLLAIALLAGGPGILPAVLAGAGFGLGRAATPFVRLSSPDPTTWDDLLRRRSRWLAAAATTAAAVAVTIALLT